MKLLLLFYAAQAVLVFALDLRHRAIHGNEFLLFCLEDILFAALAGLLWPLTMVYGILCFFLEEAVEEE